jgi:hypothetical protein
LIQIGFGDIANRVLTVGSEHRAEKIASFLDAEPAPKTITSGRGFTTITGYYKGVNISIVAIGMVRIPCFVFLVPCDEMHLPVGAGPVDDGLLRARNKSGSEGTHGYREVIELLIAARYHSYLDCLTRIIADSEPAVV